MWFKWIMLMYGVDYVFIFDLQEDYNKIISGCYSKDVVLKRIRCIEYLNEYFTEKRISIETVNERMIEDYFLMWLPYKVYTGEEMLIESFYPAAEEYFRLSDMFGYADYKVFKHIGLDIRNESERLMRLKIGILKFSNSYIISKLPCIVDFNVYKMRKASEKCDVFKDSGKFIVQGLFSNNSVVLKKLYNGQYYIRLFFNKEIIGLIRENDILDINIIKGSQSERWLMEDINGCLLWRKVYYERKIKVNKC